MDSPFSLHNKEGPSAWYRAMVCRLSTGGSAFELRKGVKLTGRGNAVSSRMASNEEESPFRRDEPVSGSAKWLWMGVAGGVVYVLAGLGARVSEPGWRTRVVAIGGFVILHGFLIWLLAWAAGFASRCRHQRSFEGMATALLAQSRFWIAITVLGILNLFLVLWMALSLHRNNDEARRFLEMKWEPAGSSDGSFRP
jgi:hypothetical protein